MYSKYHAFVFTISILKSTHIPVENIYFPSEDYRTKNNELENFNSRASSLSLQEYSRFRQKNRSCSSVDDLACPFSKLWLLRLMVAVSYSPPGDFANIFGIVLPLVVVKAPFEKDGVRLGSVDTSFSGTVT